MPEAPPSGTPARYVLPPCRASGGQHHHHYLFAFASPVSPAYAGSANPSSVYPHSGIVRCSRASSGPRATIAEVDRPSQKIPPAKCPSLLVDRRTDRRRQERSGARTGALPWAAKLSIATPCNCIEASTSARPRRRSPRAETFLITLRSTCWNRQTDYSAGDYARLARRAIAEISARARLPIVGGRLRILSPRAARRPPESARRATPTVRARLEARERRRPGSLHRLLPRLEPAAARHIHPRDVQKMIRALEIRLLTGPRRPRPRRRPPSHCAASAFSKSV